MATISTHVLDTMLGRPARGVPVTLEVRDPDGAWRLLGSGNTDDDGRLRALLPPGGALAVGVHRVTFDTARYHDATGQDCFYPTAQIVFHVRDAAQHYHIPLLLSPFAYSTYRGS